MRKLLLLLLGLVLLLAPTGLAVAVTMSNTDHDLSSSSTSEIHASDVNQICIFCHTPHKAQPAGGARPLWNHELTAQDLTWTPTTTVRGSTLPTSIIGAPLEGARACLSCHDGTVAIGSVIRYAAEDGLTEPGTNTFSVSGTGTTGGKMDSSSHAYFAPGSMQTNHPLGIQGPPGDKPGFTPFVPTQTVDNGVWYRASSDGNKYVTCQSCHNPHLSAIAPFLRISNVGSALCRTCHAI